MGAHSPSTCVSVEVATRSGAITQTKLEAGKYLTDDIYIGYQARINADPFRYQNANALRVEYQFLRRWSLQLEYGDANAGLAGRGLVPRLLRVEDDDLLAGVGPGAEPVVGLAHRRSCCALTLSSAEWVLWLLIALSVVSFAVMLERAVFFGSQRLRNGEQLAAWLTHGELDKARQAVEGQTGMEAVVVREMLLAAPQGPDTVEEVLLSVLARERARYERFLSFLGTLGSNAPFVGLFGTVLGIIKAFNDLGAVAIKGSAIQQTVMAGISEALVATAVGLGVAIPAVVAYNAYTRWLKTPGEPEPGAGLRAGGSDAVPGRAASGRPSGARRGRGRLMAAQLQDGGDDEITGINVTPLVDVVLVLLIIFMVTANFIVRETMEVDLPRAANAGETVQGLVAVVMDRQGHLYLDGAEVSETELRAKVAESVKRDPETRAILSADQALPYGEVMHLIDVVKGEGVSRFALNIEKDAARARHGSRRSP